MPGGYAHITLVNQMRERVDAAPDMPTNVRIAYGDYPNYCELGGVSPDYPYLDALNKNSPPWADLMHYTNTTDFIRAGARRIWTMSGAQQTKCLAWLLGYTAHVVGDVTIHPIVERKVGPYAQNKTHHRICEMHQDAYIFQRLNVGKVGLAEYLDKEQNGLRACNRGNDAKRIDADIFDLWNAILAEIHPGTHRLNPPDIDAWHKGFGRAVDLIEEGSALPALARHVAVNVAGATYPEPGEVDHAEYINALQTPEGPMTYDAIFDRARDNVAQAWAWIGEDIANREIERLNGLGQWNLDTGRDQNNVLAYWTE